MSIPRHGIGLVGLIVLSLLIRGPFFVEPPGRDQGLFLAQADLWLHGKQLYRDIWEHKPPGVVVLYAAAVAAFGRSYDSIQILNWLAGWSAAAALAILAIRVGCRPLSAFIGAILYLTFQSGPAFGGFWSIAQAEVLMDPVLLLAMLFLARPGSNRRLQIIRGLAAGACIGFLMLLKYSALPTALTVTALYVFQKTFPRRRFEHIAFGIGWLLPALFLLVDLILVGALTDFLRATVVFNVSHRHVAMQPALKDLVSRVLYQYPLLTALYLLAISHWLARWLEARTLGASGERASFESFPSARLWCWGFALWIAGLAQVFWQGKFWGYHYHVVLLPLCMMAAAGLDAVEACARRAHRQMTVRWLSGGLLLLSFSPYGELIQRYVAVHDISQYWLATVSQERFLSSYKWGEHDYDYVENQAVARKIRTETKEGESIFVWGFEPEVYFLADRPPSSRFLYDYPLMPQFDAVHRMYLSQLLQDLMRHPPALFLVLQNDTNDLERSDSWRQLWDLPDLKKFLETNYTPSWQLGDFVCFRRVER